MSEKRANLIAGKEAQRQGLGVASKLPSNNFKILNLGEPDGFMGLEVGPVMSR